MTQVLRPMATAPRSRADLILAQYKAECDGRKHLDGRWFSVWHEGRTESGFDLGWALYPGYGGVPDRCFYGWLPLPDAALTPPPVAVEDDVERVARAMFDDEIARTSPLRNPDTVWQDERDSWLANARAAIASLTRDNGREGVELQRFIEAEAEMTRLAEFLMELEGEIELATSPHTRGSYDPREVLLGVRKDILRVLAGPALKEGASR